MKVGGSSRATELFTIWVSDQRGPAGNMKADPGTAAHESNSRGADGLMLVRKMPEKVGNFCRQRVADGINTFEDGGKLVWAAGREHYTEAELRLLLSVLAFSFFLQLLPWAGGQAES